MSDYKDLTNMKKVFGKKKYIIHAVPAESDTQHEAKIEEEIEDLGNNLTKLFDQKINEVENTLKGVMK